MATLTLKTLYCQETEDWTGSDEPYLRVNGQTVWQGALNDQKDAPLFNEKTADPNDFLAFDFSGQATIKLFDADAGWFDDDDFLGSIQVTNQDIGLGDQTKPFNLDGAYYELTYEVTA
ncbi:hypothetical protein [Coleofasciculus sp. FACHB-SPT9]|uniref:hypothetical protein n=1 Tax=Cyanophyceae TaxID=3028117 RepID=UPI001685C977|nr:hypothetical protein [Coleofasciculus sp. FACHB-SPT9]MBD1891578.1 hypothetical protein [Coleofasciculus sp. FACHB-SPT9]